MSIHAKQVPPEYQDYYFDPECWQGIILHGNRYYNSHTTKEFDAIRERFDDEKHILRALHLLTGKRHDVRTIRGYCQGDWQTIYYPVEEYGPDDIRMIEIEYFNLGTEWIINENGEEFTQYVYGDTPEKIRAEIAAAVGAKMDDIKLHAFTGWKRTPEYEEV